MPEIMHRLGLPEQRQVLVAELAGLAYRLRIPETQEPILAAAAQVLMLPGRQIDEAEMAQPDLLKWIGCRLVECCCSGSGSE